MKDNQHVTVEMLITRVDVRTAKNGSEYMDLTLSSHDENINAKMWNSERFSASNPEVYRVITGSPGTVVKVDGRVNDFQGRKQLKIEHISLIADADPYDYMPSSPVAQADLETEFKSILDTIKDIRVKAFLERLFSGEIYETFKTAPAAKTYHHNYARGLMEHTLNICRLADKVLQAYPGDIVDRDILIAGILCHDIGKVVEYENNMGQIDITDSGKLIGHMVLGAQMAANAAAESGLDQNSTQKIIHIILAHHGQREYGAVVLPKTIEAFLVHMLDNIDAKMKRYEEVKKESSGEIWSSRQRMFNDVELFLG